MKRHFAGAAPRRQPRNCVFCAIFLLTLAPHDVCFVALLVLQDFISRMFFLKIRLRLALPLLVALPIVALSSSVRADAPVVGVRARTTGSQTFVRVRPSASTPPVAKVPGGTALYVWGRFNDWYRVETHDHVFGWVHKQYIQSRHGWKVKELSHFKAIQASEKSATQTMYGTVAELKAYHARYGGQGALKGLALKGIYLSPTKKAAVRMAQAPRVPLHQKAPVRIARVPATAPHHATFPSQENTSSTREDFGSNDAAQTLGRANEAMTPAASSLAGAVRSWTPSQPAPVEHVAPPSNIGQALGEASNRIERQSNVVRPSVPAPLRFVVPMVPARPMAPVIAAPPVQFNSASVPLGPVLPGNTALMTPAFQAPRVKTGAKPLTPQQLHTIAWQKRKRDKEQHWLWLQAQKANAWKWRVAQAQKRAAAAQQRRLWLAKQHENRGVYLASRKAGQRAHLAVKSGLKPKQMPANVPGQTVVPMSPDELLKAREQFLKKNAPQPIKETVPSTSPGTPFVPSGLSLPNLNGESQLGDLKGNLSVLLFGTAEQKAQAARDLSASSAQGTQDGQGVQSSSGATTSSSMPVFAVPAVPAQTRVAVTNIVPLPSSAAPSRGGSPRDRAAMAWRSGVANQALSYRGMPYVFGSASPSRGFDCSGLVYFLLRQRGLNPPRTAAGYRTYGQAVSRGHWQTGDLILFANTYKHGISHIGVYLKDGKFVHAASTGKGVRVDSLMKGYFASKYYGARRVK